MIGNDWDELLASDYEEEYFVNLMDFIKKEYKEQVIFPKQTEIFNAFRYTSYNDVKVVIIGQDPYHGINQAQGLSFSVREGIKKPPSLINIFKELESDLGYKPPEHGSLVEWTKEGVMLLNSVLTVRSGQPGSHANKGWEKFTDNVIRIINKKDTPVVFIFWGNYARNKKSLITNSQHYIIESAHPSPFSAYNGFFGSKPFSRTNNFLVNNNIAPVNWEIKNK